MISLPPPSAPVVKASCALAKSYLILLVLGLFFSVAGCRKPNCQTADVIGEELASVWTSLDSLPRDDRLSACLRIDSLARRCPEIFADYVVGANVLASTCFSSFKEWNKYLSRADSAAEVLEKYLTPDLSLITVNLRYYEQCRQLDTKGELESALQCYEAVWSELPKQHIDSIYLKKFRNALPISIASVYQIMGNYKRAADWISVVQRNLDTGDTYYSGLYYFLLGKMYESLGNPGTAKKNYLASVEEYAKSAETRQNNHLIESLINHSDLYLEEQQPQIALQIMQQASLYGPFTEWGQVYRHAQLAKIYVALDSMSRAIVHGQTALKTLAPLVSGKNHWRGKILRIISEAQAGQGQWRPALQTLQRSLDQLSTDQAIDDSWTTNPAPEWSEAKLELLKVLTRKAAILRNYYCATDLDNIRALQASLDTYQAAVRLIKMLRAQYHDDEVKEYLSKQSFPTFEAAVQTAVDLYTLQQKPEYLDQCFSLFETSKALSLLENLKEMEARQAVNIPRQLIRQENTFKYNIAGLEMNIRETNDSLRKSELKELLFKTRSAYAAFIDKIKNDYPTYYDLKYNTETITISQIQDLLQSDESLIEFFYGQQYLYIIHITPKRTDLEIIPISPDLAGGIEDFIRQVSSRRGLNDAGKIKTFLRTGSEIYQRLLAPFSDLSEKLIIIPDGPLHDLPFAALPTDTTFNADPEKLPYLLYRYSLRRNYSATVWRQQEFLIGKKKNKTGSLLVIAPKEFPNDSRLSLDSAQLKSLFLGVPDIITEPDKEQVLRLFEKPYDNIFIFTHASTAGGDPYFQLANDTVYLRELYTHDISANLVLLSACETGLGKHQRGEGVLSLGRGFAYQNVPNTIMTLWKVQDSPALQISTNLLYHHLSGGLSPSQALRAAQIDLINNPRYIGTPYTWAGFVSTGR